LSKYLKFKDLLFHSVASVIMDGCDSGDVDSPLFPHAPKAWDGAAKIDSKYGGILWHGGGKDSEVPSRFYLYNVDNRQTKGANFWCTTFMHNLVQEEQRRLTLSNGKYGLPPILYIQADNGSGDLKNYAFMHLAEALVRSGRFLKIKVSFLPVGHTHEDIDACFGRLSQKVRKMGFVVRHFKDCVEVCKKATCCSHDELYCIQVTHSPENESQSNATFTSGLSQLGQVRTT
jgi:hypothetical protein